jgi:hypothetical protein
LPHPFDRYHVVPLTHPVYAHPAADHTALPAYCQEPSRPAVLHAQHQLPAFEQQQFFKGDWSF